MSRRIALILSFCTTLLFILCGPAMRPVAEAEARSLKDVFNRVNPAVVVIVTGEGYAGVIHAVPVTRRSLGSGIVISKEGLIMTAAHVVNAGEDVSVYFLDGSSGSAQVVSSSQQADVALVQLKEVPDDLHPVELGDSDLASIGDEVFVVGAPYGIDHTLTVGHLSGRRKTAGICDELTPIEFLQTDAGINMGNSGGPLFSIDGKLIGIVSRILSRSGGSEGLGFAVSINTARALLMDRETFWTGLEVYLVTGELAKALNVPQKAGLLVQRVANGSTAHKMGIRSGRIQIDIEGTELLIGGDVLLEVQGMPVSPDIQETCDIRDNTRKKDAMELKVLREGRILELKSP